MNARIARVLLRVAATALLFALLVQLFTAGMAAMTDPDWWNYHVASIALSQWLVLPLPVLAVLCGPYHRRLRVLIAVCPMAQLFLQYVLAHRALEGKLRIGLGLHAVNGGLLLLVSAALAIGIFDYDRRPLNPDS